MRLHRLLWLAALLCTATGSARAASATALPSAPRGFSVPPGRLADGATAGGERLVSLEQLRLFYARREERPAWSGAQGLSPQVQPLLEALRTADREGLRPADYHVAPIEHLLGWMRTAQAATAGKTPALPAPSPDEARDLDLLLSDAFFLYASHLTRGRVSPASVEPEWNIDGRGRNLPFLLGSALDHGHLALTLGDLAPVREDYRRLRDALAAMRAVAAAGGWPTVPEGGLLREGGRDPRVAALRRRLAATGELPAAAEAGGERFDAPLADALLRFQQRNGLEPDGILGARTLAALNAPAERRVAQILANLERLRWLPRDLGPRRLVVNVADFKLELTEPGKPPLAMRIIAGQQARRTPLFTGEVTSVLFNPTWTVPHGIVLEDKLPLILDDRDFFADHGFRVLARSKQGWREIDQADVDWTSLIDKPFPYRLRQDPGPKNALGRIKFEIPNRHDIYLHDTPSLGLFARAERTFSSGCIRVERALDLAERLLGDARGWTRTRIEEAVAAGNTLRVSLAEPLPVYLFYWTAWVDHESRLQLREDVYGSDTALLEALARPLSPR